jgi:hypothetical protein
MFVMVKDFSEVQAERDSRNDAADDEAPPVMPAHLVSFGQGSSFNGFGSLS